MLIFIHINMQFYTKKSASEFEDFSNTPICGFSDNTASTFRFFCYRDLDPGDISEQIKIREKLKCKPFKWFMQEVAFDLYKHYPPVDPPDFVHGEIRYLQYPFNCMQNWGFVSALSRTYHFKFADRDLTH